MKNWGELVRQDNGKGIRLCDRVTVIGRGYDCDIRLEQPCVSRVHAVISRENGKTVLEDLGGKTDTLVNRAFINRRVLADGDRIQIGRTALVFRYPKASGLL
jgi:pSer/pThr/pTyr-binding forkhead associated (FHA) protein